MKRIIRPLLAGLCIGVVLAVVQQALHIDHGVFMTWFWAAAAVMFVGILLFNFLYMGRYRRKMRDALALLEAGQAQEYLAMVEGLLQTARGRGLRNCLKLDLTPGYCDLKQFDKAIAILEELSREPLRGVPGMVRRLNLCVCYFYTCQTAKAMELYEASQKEFAPWRTTPVYGGNVAVLDMFAAIAQGRQEQAAQLLAHARSTWTNPRLQDDYDYIEKLLAEAWPAKP